MKKSLCFVVAMLAFAHAAPAQLRVFVASTGNDSNTATFCSRAAPCRNLQAAVNTVVPNGEVIILDSAGYGTTLSIPKGVSITAAAGVYGGLNLYGTTGITITAPAGEIVRLQNLVLNGAPTSNTGVLFSTGKALYVTNCTFIGNQTAGLTVSNASGRTVIEKSLFSGNVVGLKVTTGLVNVIDSTFASNTTAIHAVGNGGYDQSPPNGTTRVRLYQGTYSDNTTVFLMEDPGLRLSGQCNGANVFLQSTQNMVILGNSTYVTAIGNHDPNAGCSLPAQFGVGSWGSPMP